MKNLKLLLIALIFIMSCTKPEVIDSSPVLVTECIIQNTGSFDIVNNTDYQYWIVNFQDVNSGIYLESGESVNINLPITDSANFNIRVWNLEYEDNPELVNIYYFYYSMSQCQINAIDSLILSVFDMTNDTIEFIP